MAENDVGKLLADMEGALTANRESLAELAEAIDGGNRIIKRKTAWIAITCASVVLDLTLTLAIAVFGYELNGTQKDTAAAVAAERANTCNLNSLLAQSVASSGNTVDLYRGLRPLLAAASDPDSRAAVTFIDRSIANVEGNAKTRADFLALTRDTADRLDCPPGFVAPSSGGGR